MDGVTHINIYSQGKTSLGRDLSNFAATRIDTIDGVFASIEGYWYWLNTNDPDKKYLRVAVGGNAKSLGRSLKANDWNDEPVFKLKIWSAMLTKLLLHPNILSEFKSNKLPYRHYYVYAGKVQEPEGGKWIIDMWTFLQEQLCTS